MTSRRAVGLQRETLCIIIALHCKKDIFSNRRVSQRYTSLVLTSEYTISKHPSSKCVEHFGDSLNFPVSLDKKNLRLPYSFVLRQIMRSYSRTTTLITAVCNMRVNTRVNNRLLRLNLPP